MRGHLVPKLAADETAKKYHSCIVYSLNIIYISITQCKLLVIHIKTAEFIRTAGKECAPIYHALCKQI